MHHQLYYYMYVFVLQSNLSLLLPPSSHGCFRNHLTYLSIQTSHLDCSRAPAAHDESARDVSARDVSARDYLF